MVRLPGIREGINNKFCIGGLSDLADTVNKFSVMNVAELAGSEVQVPTYDWQSFLEPSSTNQDKLSRMRTDSAETELCLLDLYCVVFL